MSTKRRRIVYVLVVILIATAALGLRLRGVRLFQVDYDEDNYLAAAQRYAQFIAAGDMHGIVDYAYMSEHPPLAKLALGLALLPLPKAPLLPEPPPAAPRVDRLPQPQMRVARTVSAAFGTLEVLALAIFNPLAGLFLGIHTWSIKYTSEIMIEALPSLTSLLAVLFYIQAKRISVPPVTLASAGWLLLSAVALGLTAASKYIYCVAGIAIMVDWVGSSQSSHPLQGTPADPRSTGRWADLTRRLGWLLLWSLVAGAIFFAADPRMWSDPLHRLTQSVLYHGNYAQSAPVEEAAVPFWKPLVWLLLPVRWPPGIFVIMLDTFIGLLAILGLRRLWHSHRVAALWLIIGLGFLLLWPAKWPQYMKTISAPLCLAAAEGFHGCIREPLLRWYRAPSLPRWARRKKPVNS